ncbi:hypothetical protein AAG570_001746 [Ranatra chinensis]|uniref:Nuclear factor of activated T-cells 5 n=1 Tax=Ranatra chinensis TaxID=642074 RepID=A0ABD0Y9E5_9HEMI
MHPRTSQTSLSIPTSIFPKSNEKFQKNKTQETTENASKRELDPPETAVDPCDNSNDSGLGFDHHLEYSLPRSNISPTFSDQEYWSGVEDAGESKKRRLDIKLETDDANDNFTFQCQRKAPISRSPSAESLTQSNAGVVNAGVNCVVAPPPVPLGGKVGGGKRGQTMGSGASCAVSRDGAVQLQILTQPEMQHRARYQTEGSRGAVKDRSGNAFPVVKLSGYDKPATLEVYIGTDQGKVAPHMFYQACRVAGKNSTPCVEQVVNGTVLIKIEFEPSKDMVVICDCVGILKERNVDVEHRFPEEGSSRSKKKSTRCRMVFRTTITRTDGTLETLQATSQPIVCTQPPGIPEICKKSLSSCDCTGGLELFILGKNFLKDTKVMFCHGKPSEDDYWEHIAQPDKDFLQQSHLVCTIPAYRCDNIRQPVVVQLHVVSSGKSSEPHCFVYTPRGTPPLQVLPQDLNSISQAVAPNISRSTLQFTTSPNLLLGAPLHMLPPDPQMQKVGQQTFIADDTTKCNQESLLGWVEGAGETAMMPPPQGVPPLAARRDPTQTAISTFVTDTTTLPSLTVDTYFSRIENKPPEKSIYDEGQAGVIIEQTPAPSALLVVDTRRTLFDSVSEVAAQQSLGDTQSLLVAPSEESHPVLGFSPGKQIVSTAMAQFSGPTLMATQSFPNDNPVGSESDGVAFATTNSSAASSGFEAAIMLSSTGFTPTEKVPVSDTTTTFFSPEKHPPEGFLMPPPPDYPGPGLMEPFSAQVLEPSQPPPTVVDDKPPELMAPTQETATAVVAPAQVQSSEKQPKKCEEGIPLPQELTQMSEHDLLSYINPSCFDQELEGGPDGVVVSVCDYHAEGPGFDSLRGQSWLKARLAS